jgi:hypothetical protein
LLLVMPGARDIGGHARGVMATYMSVLAVPALVGADVRVVMAARMSVLAMPAAACADIRVVVPHSSAGYLGALPCPGLNTPRATPGATLHAIFKESTI